MHAAVSGWLLGPASGANRRLLALLRELDSLLTDGERITVLHRPGHVPIATTRIEWYEVDIPAGPTLPRARTEQRVLPTLLRDLGANVYDHGFLPLPRLAIPTCLTVHDLRAIDGHTRWPRWLARAALRRSCERADALITPSEYTARRLQCAVPKAEKPIVVHNAAHFAADWQSLPAPRPIPDNGYLLHVGHLEPRKNLEVVIEALAAIPAHTRPHLWLVGNDSGHGQRLERHAQHHGVSAFVQQFGTVDDTELRGYYQHARLVVMPSRYEGFGLPALEGLVHGRPVLAADATALPEVVGDVAVMLPVDDASAWATAILRSYPDEREHRAERSAWASCFNWQVSATDLLATWRALSSRSR